MMRRLSVSFFLSCASVLLAVGGKSLSFTERPMLAGHTSLTENGFVVSRTLGTANFSPELRLPVQLVYESASEKRGAFGFVWRSPQLESRAYFTKDAAVWTTPWVKECRFPLKDGALLTTAEWSASFSGESPETAVEWTFTGRNGKRGWTFRYAKSRLVEIVAPSGRRQTWTYDKAGRLAAVSQNGRDFIAMTYNDGLVSGISINAVVTSFSYKAMPVVILPKVATGRTATPTLPRLVAIATRGMAPVEFRYGETYLARISQDGCKEELTVENETLEERLANLKSRDRKSGVKHTGKVAGRLLRDATFDYAYSDANPGKVSVTDRKGQRTQFDFDRLKGVFSITDAGGRQTRLFYYMRHDVAYLGRQRKVVDWKGRDAAAWQYDRETANPVSLVNPIGNETLLSYDRNGCLTRAERRTSTDSRAEPAMAFEHGALGELLSFSMLDAEGRNVSTTRFTYDGHLQPTEAEDGRGALRVAYNDFGYLSKITGRTGAVIRRVGYDDYNRPVAFIDANDVETRLSRNESGLVTRVEKRHGGRTLASLAVEYDGCGRLKSYADHKGCRRAFERDEFWRVVKELLPDGTSIAYSFDAAGNLAKVFDQNRHEISFDWSAFGLDSRTTAIGQVTDYVHDKFGLLTSVSSMRGSRTDRRIAYKYDRFDRPVKITCGPCEVETLVYDAWGRVASRTRGNRRADYRYDHFGRLDEKDEAGIRTSYTYNAYGQRLTRTVREPKGTSTETRKYDVFGRLSEIAKGGRAVQFYYDAQGRVASQSLDGVQVAFSYTSTGQLESKTWGDAASPFATLKYIYDGDGSLVGREINGRRQNYVQDSRGQLLAVRDAEGNILEEYRYDPAGNVLSKTVNGKTTVFEYDSANQLVSSTCGGKRTAYAYDAAGRMVREGGRAYRYAWLDKVTSVMENDRPFAQYDYFVDGQLASARYTDTSKDFLWDGLALVRRGARSYINEPHPGGGAPVLSGEGGAMLSDMLGTTLGTIRGGNAEMTDSTAFGETLDKGLLFTGKPMVDGLGYAFLFRNYQPQIGKWLTSDPIGYPDGWNNLAYCNNSFINCFDYLGCDIYHLVDVSETIGHSALIIGNKSYGYFAINNGPKGGGYSPFVSSANGREYFKYRFPSPQAALAELNRGRSGKDEYDLVEKWDTSYAEDVRAILAAVEVVNEGYDPVTNNCMHAVDAALDASEVWHIDPGTTGILSGGLMVYNGIVYGLNTLGCSFNEASFSIPLSFYLYNLAGSSANYLDYTDFKKGIIE